MTVSNDAVTFSGPGGAVEFRRTASGGWIPPVGSTAVLTQSPSGQFTLHDAGMVFVFRSDGTIESVRSSFDTAAGTGPVYTWTPKTINGVATNRLTAITDPVSDRSVTLTYKEGSNCTPPAGFQSPPEGFLCQIDFWDGTTQYLRYYGNLLVRLEQSNGIVYDYWYWNGLLYAIRDPLDFDAWNAGFADGTSAELWYIDYYPFSTYNPRRALAVTAPRPVPGAARPKHIYSYGADYTEIDIEGLNPSSGYARRVEFDAAGRQTVERDAAGRAVATTTWDTANERVRWVDDAAGLRTSYVYDSRGAVTDTYGPAPSSWFAADVTPQAAYASQTPRRQTGYDENIVSLAATWWDNADLAGAPKVDGTGVGGTGGAIAKDWGAGAPSGITGGDNWSGRLNGTIVFPDAGSYDLQLQRDGKVRLWLDDSLLIDAWAEASTTVAATTPSMAAGSRHRLVIEYADTAGNANLTFGWRLAGSGDFATVPGSQLSPMYLLPTSSVDADGKTTTTSYGANPHLGLAEGSTKDPSGLALTSGVTLETSGLRRPTAKTLPAGNQYSYAYYGSAETADDPCTAGTQEINQNGALKSRTSPSPASITQEYVYDVAGRLLASRVGNESWICNTYDARGRLIQRTVPSFGGEAGRTVTYDYDVGTPGNPLVSSVTDPAGTITTKVDLLGRVVETTDVWGKTRTYSYDQAGRVTQTVGPEGTIAYSYSDTGAVTQQRLDGLVVANVAYDAVTGRVQSYSFPSGTGNGGNGTSSADLSYDTLGRLVGLTWRDSANNMLTSDAYTYSLAGRVKDRSVDGVDANPGGDNCLYDGAGRLTQAYVNGVADPYQYNYSDSHTCGVAAAGKNTNRTTLVVGAATETYCYNAADQLTSFTSGGTTWNFSYDAHGNTSAVNTQSFTYDAENRHLSTTDNGSTVRYTRDANGAIVERRLNGTVTARFSGPAVLDATGTVVSRTIRLPGGVLLTTTAAGDTWSYPNLHGDIAAAANAAGVKQGSTNIYDPYGNLKAGQGITNLTTDFNYLWSGVQPTEHNPAATGGVPRIEMGARQYAPILGRFLSTDPVDGGSANDYEYALGDPVNLSDYSGMCTGWCQVSYGLSLIRRSIRRVSVDWCCTDVAIYFHKEVSQGANLVLKANILGAALINILGFLVCTVGLGVAIGDSLKGTRIFGIAAATVLVSTCNALYWYHAWSFQFEVGKAEDEGKCLALRLYPPIYPIYPTVTPVWGTSSHKCYWN